MWVAEITDRETHTRQWLGSFHTAELAAMEYDRWPVRYHGAAARLNFPFGTRPVHLVPPEPGVVSSAMARDDREVGSISRPRPPTRPTCKSSAGSTRSSWRRSG